MVLGLKFSESHPPVNRAANGGVSFINGPELSMSAFNPMAAVSVLPFTDVAAGSWYLDAVRYVYEKDLMQGTSGSAFAPNQPMNRAMVWTILARLSGEDTTGGSPWYAPAQSWSVAEGVSDGTDPGGTVTREQLAAMLWRNAGSPGGTADLNQFSDSGSVSDYAASAIRWAAANGILQGSGGKLNPKGTATRAQVAAMVRRYGSIKQEK